MPRRPLLRCAALLTAVLAAVGTARTPVRADGGLTPAQAQALGWHAEARLLEAHRQVRDDARAAGEPMSVLTPMTDVRAAARAWSAVMAEEGTLAHNPSTSTSLCCYREARESVGQARGVTDRWRVDEAVQTLMASFLASPSHRDNLLAPAATDVGVGVTVDLAGNLWASIYVRERLRGEEPPGEPYTATSLFDAAATVLAASPIPAPPLRARNFLATCVDTPAAGFGDVPPSVHAAAIDCVAHLGLMDGRAPHRFDPATTLTRGQAATLTSRLLAWAGVRPPATGIDHFVDDDGSVHEPALDLLADLGLLPGPQAFPLAPATRAEVARFVARALVAAGVTVDASVLPDYFTDDDGLDDEQALNLLAHLGVLVGDGLDAAGPQVGLRRAQMATILARAADAVP